MYLYYTGARQYLENQSKKELSLGGFASSIRIQNGEIGNLFSEVSLIDIERELREVIGIVLKNESGMDVADLRLWFESPEDAFCKFEIAAVTLSKDSKDQYFMEEITNSESLPYNATFYTANNFENNVLLGVLANNGMIGLWIKRTIDKTIVSSQFTTEALKARVTPLSTQEDVSLKLSWSEDESSSV